MSCYRNFMRFFAKNEFIPIIGYKNGVFVTCTGIVMYNLLALHRDIFIDEVGRNIYCNAPVTKPSELVEYTQKALRYTNRKLFDVTYNNTWVFKPDTPEIIEFCSPANMSWNAFRLIRALIGFLFISVSWVGIYLEYESIYMPFILYGFFIFILDWYNWLDDIRSIFKNSITASCAIFVLWLLGAACLIYTMWGLYCKFCDLLYYRPRTPPYGAEPVPDEEQPRRELFPNKNKAGGSGEQASGSDAQASGNGAQASGSGLQASGSGLQASGSGLQASGSGLQASGSGARTSGNGEQFEMVELAKAQSEMVEQAAAQPSTSRPKTPEQSM